MNRTLRILAVASSLTIAASVNAQTPFTVGPYSYDASGNITEIGTDTFRYDEFGRLKTATVAQHPQQYTYDRYGNMTEKVMNGSTISIAADPGSNRLFVSASHNVDGQHDAAGNVIRFGSDTFTPDAVNMPKGAMISGQQKVYLYTAGDERIGTIDVMGATEGPSNWTLRDTAGQVLRIFTKSGASWSWSEDYVYREHSVLAAEVATSARTLHFHPDHLGTPRLITGNGGVAVAKHTYDPFGFELTSGAQDGERMKFTGHERDTPGLDYMLARFYGTGLGRFMAVDPARESVNANDPQTWNRFTYAWNNPVLLVDRDGRNPAVVMNNTDRYLILYSILKAAWQHKEVKATGPNLSGKSIAKLGTGMKGWQYFSFGFGDALDNKGNIVTISGQFKGVGIEAVLNFDSLDRSKVALLAYIFKKNLNKGEPDKISTGYIAGPLTAEAEVRLDVLFSELVEGFSKSEVELILDAMERHPELVEGVQFLNGVLVRAKLAPK